MAEAQNEKNGGDLQGEAVPSSEVMDALPAEMGVSLEKRNRAEIEGESVALDGEKAEAPRHPLWKTSLCTFFIRDGGSCVHGSDCRFAHGDEELRIKPDNTWDPNSQKAKKLKSERELNGCGRGEQQGGAQGIWEMDDLIVACEEGSTSLDKCLVGLPMRWTTDNLKSFLQNEGVSYSTAKKKKGMTVGFLSFSDLDQIKSAIKELNGKSVGGKPVKMAEANRRVGDRQTSAVSNEQMRITSADTAPDQNTSVSDNFLINDGADDGSPSPSDGSSVKARSARDAVTPLADVPYVDQLEHKKNSLAQTLKRLTRNARKACPNGVSLPDWILKAREIGGLPCPFEGIISSPVTQGYRNKCEFSVGYSPQGKKTVGFMLGNFRDGITAVMEPVECPNVSYISYKYALLFQEFLQSSDLPVWNRIENTGFWRQLTVREGRNPNSVAVDENAKPNIAEVMLIVQVCTSGVDAEFEKSEFEKMGRALALGASECSPPMPLTSLVVQDHIGISNAAPADCPLRYLSVTSVGKESESDDSATPRERIHDYISDLQFSISPTAFFQVNTLAAEKLYSLAGDWANLSSDTLLFDVCCGTGTIGLTLSGRVGMVIGIEMNGSAVADAQRNAEINGITNCKFVCGKAEDVIGTLLKDYVDVRDDDPANIKSGPDAMEGGEGAQAPTDTQMKQNEGTDSAPRRFRNVVAIVDPPRMGLHPTVTRTLRTYARLERLVYISCNPESLVANAIELCTPSSDQAPPAGRGGGRAWRSMSSAGLARQRARAMPSSAPFRPVRAAAVDLFPHTPHCELVMLLER
ncbi:zinc finger (CCCH-type) family protein [Wolffia australiana]